MNKILKTVGLVILVFATQLFSMFVYERCIQRSTMQQIMDKQHALRLLHLEYRQKNILPKTIITDEQLRLWGTIDISEPRSMYEDLIRTIQEEIKSCWLDTSKQKLEEELEDAIRNKEALIEFFRQEVKILRG